MHSTKYFIKEEEKIKGKFKGVSKVIGEKGIRIWAATEANSLGFGGISAVSRATGLDQKTIRKGIKELHKNDLNGSRERKAGGGRKTITETNEGITNDLSKLLEPATRGDPESALLWTSKSSYKLCDELCNMGYKICPYSVQKLLKNEGYSLQSNKKVLEGNSHEDRDEQFEHIYSNIKTFQIDGNPVISVDGKKKEKIGEFKNNGQEYHKKGTPTKVNTYDFIDETKGKVTPYGVYDVTHNKGWVNVGISSDTAQFSVESIRTWWYDMGVSMYSGADKIMITADCGGSNGYRNRLWKSELQKLANEINMPLQVNHLPPGTSKWNKIEHKMFSFISKNWRGRPLISTATVVNLISNTTTKKGLKIKAALDSNEYKKGIKISDKEMKEINIKYDDFHKEWNYTIHPIN